MRDRERGLEIKKDRARRMGCVGLGRKWYRKCVGGNILDEKEDRITKFAFFRIN